MNSPVSICIIEDHNEMRSSISFIINACPEFYCTAYLNAEEALKGFRQEPPKVVLMDIDLPGMDGIECTRKITALYPNTLIMMCTVFEDSEKIFKALQAGAKGYILKRSAGGIVDAIKELLAGGAPMSGEIARKVVNSFREIPAKETHDVSLTKKENEILDLLAKGYSNKELADKLFVSLNTIRSHIYHIYEKLHVRNRVEALNKVGKK